MSFPLPASRQNRSPNTRGQGIFPKRATYFPDNNLSNRPPDRPGSEISSANACLCDFQAISFLSIFQKNYHGGVAPPIPHGGTPSWKRPIETVDGLEPSFLRRNNLSLSVLSSVNRDIMGGGEHSASLTHLSSSVVPCPTDGRTET